MGLRASHGQCCGLAIERLQVSSSGAPYISAPFSLPGRLRKGQCCPRSLLSRRKPFLRGECRSRCPLAYSNVSTAQDVRPRLSICAPPLQAADSFKGPMEWAGIAKGQTGTHSRYKPSVAGLTLPWRRPSTCCSMYTPWQSWPSDGPRARGTSWRSGAPHERRNASVRHERYC